MRIQPLANSYKNNKNNPYQTFKRNNVAINKPHHQYTGNACADLAYASLVDSNIANDLRNMGIIV